MPQKTNIEWADYTSNLLRYRDRDGKTVWGCVKESPGCAHCYSEALALRFKRGAEFTARTMERLTPYFCHDERYKIERMKSLSGKRVFVNDMTDTFGPWVKDWILERHWWAFYSNRHMTFMLLTKHPKRASKVFAGPLVTYKLGLPNVWLGTSVENQQTADERIPHLLECPAAVRFLSVEPMLGPVRLKQWEPDGNWPPQKPQPDSVWISHKEWVDDFDYAMAKLNGIHWLIVGAESGPNRRPFDWDWARALRDQCQSAGVAFFMKQGTRANGSVTHELDEFPPDMRTREFPRNG